MSENSCQWVLSLFFIKRTPAGLLVFAPLKEGCCNPWPWRPQSRGSPSGREWSSRRLRAPAENGWYRRYRLELKADAVIAQDVLRARSCFDEPHSFEKVPVDYARAKVEVVTLRMDGDAAAARLVERGRSTADLKDLPKKRDRAGMRQRTATNRRCRPGGAKEYLLHASTVIGS